MDRMKLTAGVLALVTVFGMAACNQRPGTNADKNQTMERGGGAGGAATSPESGSSSGTSAPSSNAPGDNSGSMNGGSSGGSSR
jgi:hypothetical protein